MKQLAMMILLSTAASVQAAPIPTEQAIELCRAEQNALRRLNCYDAISANTSTVSSVAPIAANNAPATSSKPAAIAQPQAVAETSADSSFGLEHKKSAEQSADKIYVTAKTISENKYRGLSIEFTNGQIWQQQGSDYYQIKQGEEHYIRRGALGSFFLANDRNNRAIRVKREQ
ncbi:MAG TPA: hypothetical protein VFY01_05235 [Rheinheimera sp.]|nr:hypothetical protein [Rheinheimera sp.]